jgi:hypothetical protein
MSALARFVAQASLPVVLLAAGCTSQGEGDRCSMNADCQAGLTCRVSASFGVCCSGASTVPACNPGLDAGTVEMEAGAEAAVEDAGTDTGAPEEASTGSD